MAMPLIKGMKWMPQHHTTAKGLISNDWDAVTPFQAKCTEDLCHTIQLEEEAYIIKHPEINEFLLSFLSPLKSSRRTGTDKNCLALWYIFGNISTDIQPGNRTAPQYTFEYEVLAMLKLLVCRVNQNDKDKNILLQAANHFTRPYEVLDEEVRKLLKSPPTGPYTSEETRRCGFEDTNLKSDIARTVLKFYPLLPKEMSESEPETPNTLSSSFISVLSSATTIPTPEPIPTPPPTLSETLLTYVENCMDKATMVKLTDKILKYDTAYVEVMKMVEEVMEIPVKKVREDIVELIANAYAAFDEILDERAQEEAAIAWDRRMRKKLKRTLRRQDNFRGYETPPTPKSSLPSSHESYRVPPQRPCKCHPQWTYNRYSKDRFGIYLPREEQYELTSITASPPMSSDGDEEANV